MNDTNLGSDSEFDKSDDNDSANQRDSIEMKITKAKLMAEANISTAVDPNLKARSGKPKQ